jgi:hypothetical protein
MGWLSGSFSWRVFAAVALVVSLAGGALACEQGAEGDRCNPDRAANGSDECDAPLTCQQPTSCVIDVCCPPSPPYADPQCACLAHPGPGCACYVGADEGGVEDARHD